MGKNVRELKRVLLVEAGGSHDECLYSQVNALSEAGIDFRLALDFKTASRFESDKADITIVRNEQDGDADITKAIQRLVKEYKPDIVVFNTAQGSFVRNLALLHLFNKTRFVGLIHTTRKFKGSFTQKLINLKIKEYLFLAEFLRNDAKSNTKGKFHLDYFYTLDFPVQHKKKEAFGSKRIVIVGGVEKRRKDLEGLVEMMADPKLSDYTFVFLGKSDAQSEDVLWLKRNLIDRNLIPKVILFEDFVSHADFDREMNNAAYVLPLIHPNTPSADQYFKNQIPGAMNISIAWKTPMLIHKEYQWIKELNVASFYYGTNEFTIALNSIDSDAYRQKIHDMEANEMYDPLTQRKRFIGFLRNENNDGSIGL